VLNSIAIQTQALVIPANCDYQHTWDRVAAAAVGGDGVVGVKKLHWRASYCAILGELLTANATVSQTLPNFLAAA
jgi:hypothetical protein